jgi:hypothetical protein
LWIALQPAKTTPTMPSETATLTQEFRRIFLLPLVS